MPSLYNPVGPLAAAAAAYFCSWHDGCNDTNKRNLLEGVAAARQQNRVGLIHSIMRNGALSCGWLPLLLVLPLVLLLGPSLTPLRKTKACVLANLLSFSSSFSKTNRPKHVY
jgi:hypothetical protein